MNIIEPQFLRIVTDTEPVNYEYNRATILNNLSVSLKSVNYEYSPATISNNQCSRPNQSIMNIIEPQFLRIVTDT